MATKTMSDTQSTKNLYSHKTTTITPQNNPEIKKQHNSSKPTYQMQPWKIKCYHSGKFSYSRFILWAMLEV